MLSAKAKSIGGWIVFAMIASTWLAFLCTIAYVIFHFVAKYW